MKENPEEQHDFVKDITKMSVDFDRWYTDVIRKAEMADWSGVRGMMVVRPYGWAMWEAITRAFDDMIKESGHENWAFPLLIPRELLVKADWRGELRFRERGELRRRGHRPDLVGRLPDGQLLPIEVELTEKSSARLKAVLQLHAEWISAGKSAAVIYVCGDEEIAGRVLADGGQAGLSVDRGTMRIELVATIQREAVEACSTLAATEWHLAGREAA